MKPICFASRRNAGRHPGRHPGRQRGVAAVEFALLAILFFTFVFGLIELARLVYVFNTVQETTRYAANAAALTSHRDSAALERIRQRAVFRDTPGDLLLGTPVSDASVRIDYLALPRTASGELSLQPIPAAALPFCPRNNREICLANPHAANCIRFVRASICANDGAAQCNPVVYRTFVPLVALPVPVPKATTIRAVESFGSMPEGTPCL